MRHPVSFLSVPHTFPSSRPSSLLPHAIRSSTFVARQVSARQLQLGAVRTGVRPVGHVLPVAMSVTSPPPSPTDQGMSTPVPQREEQAQRSGVRSRGIEEKRAEENQLSPNNLSSGHTVAKTAIAAAMTSQAEHPDAVYIPVQLHTTSPTPNTASNIITAYDGEEAPTIHSLPPCLHGLRLLRMGPGIFDGLTHGDGQPFAVGHWFDGLCLLHDFTFSSPSPSTSASMEVLQPTLRYRSRSLTKHVQRTIAATPRWRWVEMSFGSPPLLAPRTAVAGDMGGRERSWLRKLADAAVSTFWPVKDPVTNNPPMPNVPVLLQQVGDKGLSARSDGTISMQVLLNDKDEGGLNHSRGIGLEKMSAIEAGSFFTLADVDPRLNGFFAASHAGIDDKTGDMYNFVFGLDDLDKHGEVAYTIFRLPVTNTASTTDATTTATSRAATGPAHILASFRAPPVYMHSVGLTPTFVIVTLWPMVLRPLRFLLERAMTRAMMFDRRLDTEFRLVRRDNGSLATRVIAPAAFVFHIANAFDVVNDCNGEGTVKEVGLDVCWFDDGNKIVDAMSLRSMRSATRKSDFPKGKLLRYTLPVVYPATNADDVNGGCSTTRVVRAQATTLYDGYVELPCVAPCAVNEPGYRFVYGVAHDDGVFDCVVKIDVSSGEVVGRWSCGDGEGDDDTAAGTGERGVVGEPVFVPHVAVSAAVEEDDGVLLVVTVERAAKGMDGLNDDDGDEKEWRSRLVVLCAKHMRLIASAVIPRVVPLGYHGTVMSQ